MLLNYQEQSINGSMKRGLIFQFGLLLLDFLWIGYLFLYLPRKIKITEEWRGLKSPLFFILKMKKELVEQFVIEALSKDPSLFLIDLEILQDNKIAIVLDGDNGVPLNQCIRVSRAVEGNLDREEEDFCLEVSSPDITKPLKVKRQYAKNKGRILKVKTEEEMFEGKLEEVSDDGILLTWKTREPKPVGKGKVTVEKKENIAYNNIVEAKVKLIF